MLGGEPDGLEVDPVHGVPRRLRELVHGALARRRERGVDHAGVVDQDVETSERGGRAVHHRLDRGPVLEVHADDLRGAAVRSQLLGRRGGGRLVAVGEGDGRRALAGHRDCDGPPDALSRARHERDLAVELRRVGGNQLLPHSFAHWSL